MSHPSVSGLSDSDAITSFSLSEDGYIRLPPLLFCATELQHLMSGLEGPALRQRLDSDTDIVGYTEWVSLTNPVITVGWDWRLAAVGGTPGCVRIAEPFSNVMFVDDYSRDLGSTRTAQLLSEAIDRRPWSPTVLAAIAARYS